MLFSFTAEQNALRSSVHEFAGTVLTEAATRSVMDTELGYDLTTWRRLAGDMGLSALAVPEEHGGGGAGIVELAVVAEELGRVLYSGPWLSTVLAAAAVADSADPAVAAHWLPRLADGAAATVAVAEAAGAWHAEAIECDAPEGPAGWSLRGAKHYVAHAAGADLYVVAARAPDGVALFALDGADPGLAVTPVAAFDRTRRLSRLDLGDAPARRISAAGSDAALTGLLRLAAVLSAAEAVGGAQASLDLAVDYAKHRVQFGRVIGSFQAIKHMCADRLLDVESARSAAYYAAWAAAGGSADLPAVVPLAKAFCSDVFFDTAKDSMQIHGGISFTWEHPSHLYYRRAKSSRTLWGDPQAHREAVAAAIGL
jgi:alkylation response protein AidB-like acyl-CoA dehydrogenase